MATHIYILYYWNINKIGVRKNDIDNNNNNNYCVTAAKIDMQLETNVNWIFMR